jgi:RimJ/RimL family protein N-acetyltransferase
VDSAFLVGEQVSLAPLSHRHAPTLATWMNDPLVRRNLRRFRPVSLAGELYFLDGLAREPGDTVLGISAREPGLPTGKLIGVCGLHGADPRHRCAELGICIGDRSAWGKGFGTEATRLLVRHGHEALRLHRIYLHVYEDNAPAIRVYEKVGFRREGVLREEHFREGRFWDTVVMSILPGEPT